MAGNVLEEGLVGRLKLSEDDEEQDIARSSYADMLCDDERNKAYNQAIDIAIDNMINSTSSKEKRFLCCDIGTGSSLLSMMVVRSFLSRNYNNFEVHAYEEFRPMAECAKKVIEVNQYSPYITVHPQRSTTVEPRPSAAKYDLCVAELLDTELIGEGCLEVYRHAVEHLCSPSCVFIPHQARIYIEPVDSRLLRSRHCLEKELSFKWRQKSKVVKLNVPADITTCPGLLDVVDDIQASALREDTDFTRLTEPQIAFDIEFGKLETLNLDDHNKLIFKLAHKPKESLVIVMWWDIVMYDKKKLFRLPQCVSDLDKIGVYNFPHLLFSELSCAPNWARSRELCFRDMGIDLLYDRQVWREHWIQAVYNLYNKQRALTIGSVSIKSPGESSTTEAGSELTVHAYHDSHSLWFEETVSFRQGFGGRAICLCELHRRLSRWQVAAISEPAFMEPLIGAWLSAPSTSCSSELSADFEMLEKQVEWNSQLPKPRWRLKLKNATSLTTSYLYEPRLITDGWWLWKCWEASRAAGEHAWGSAEVESCTIHYAQVCFDNLNRIRTKAGKVEGFDLGPMDTMIEGACQAADSNLEPHYLCEYPCIRLDQSHELAPLVELRKRPHRFRLTAGLAPNRMAQRRPRLGRGWALVFWADFQLANGGGKLSTGPKELNVRPGTAYEWPRYSMQLVHFLHQHPAAGQLDKAASSAGRSSDLNSIEFELSTELRLTWLA